MILTIVHHVKISKLPNNQKFGFTHSGIATDGNGVLVCGRYIGIMSAQCSIADGQLRPTCRNLEWNNGSREPRESKDNCIQRLQQTFARTENKQTIYERLI
jgi:hypothetical protein